MSRVTLVRVFFVSVCLILAVVITGATDGPGSSGRVGEPTGRVELRAPAVVALVEATEGRARVDFDPATGLATFVGFGPDGFRLETEDQQLMGRADRARAFLARFGDAFGTQDASTELEFVSETANAGGVQVELRQLYEGLPVNGGSLRVYFDGNSNLTAVDGRCLGGISVDTTPRLQMPGARAIAVDFVYQGMIARSRTIPSEVGATGGTLVVYRTGSGTDHLAYEIDVTVAGEMGRRVWVDGHDGQVVDQVAAFIQGGAPQFETKTTTSNPGVPGKAVRGFTPKHVDLDNTYVSPVVVCTAEYKNNANTTPVVVRVESVTTTGFAVALQTPGMDIEVGTLSETIHCLIVEAGSWIIDGHKLEAQRYLSTVTDRKFQWPGETQSYQQPGGYTNPVVVGQVMSILAEDAWSVFWSKGSSRTSPPSSSALTTGKHVGEDTDTTRLDQEVGFIVFEAAHGMIGGVEFEAGVGSKTVSGATASPPYNYSFAPPFATDPQVGVASLAGMAGGDGGWAQLHPTSPAMTTTTLQLSGDEDQIGDAERSRAAERVAYVVFEEQVVYPVGPPDPPDPCFSDVDCQDGSFCNGEETCFIGVPSIPGTCLPAAAEACLGQTCDEVNDVCVTGPALRMETLVLTGVDGDFQEVGPLNHTYVNPVIVCNAEYKTNTIPVVTRIDNVTSSSFEIKLQSASGGTPSAEDVHCIVMEAGMWTQDGVNFEAQRYDATVVDRKGLWTGREPGYLHSYTTPTVIGQVMSHNDPDFSVYWQQGSARNQAPTASALRNGMTVLEDLDTTRTFETVAFIVFESGHGPFLTSTYEAATGSDIVGGVFNGAPFEYEFNAAFSGTPMIAVTSMAGIDGADGAWSQLHAASPSITPTTLNLSVDEDQLRDTERSHTTEQVSYVVFETLVSFPAVEDCEFDDDCPGFENFCDGPDTCNNGACIRGATPCGIGEECTESGLDDGDGTCSNPSPKLETVLVTDVGGLEAKKDALGAQPVRTVELTNTYDSPVVVCTVRFVDTTWPLVPRVRNVLPGSFELYLQNPGDQVIPVPEQDVDCLVVEEGVWNIAGVQFEAQTFTTTITDHDPTWLGAAQGFGNSYTSPVIVGQVMSCNDPLWSVYWQSGEVRANPPNNGFLRNGKGVGEDSEIQRIDEEIGFIVFEEGTGEIDGVVYEAFLTADFVRNATGAAPFTHPLTAPFTADPEFAVLSGAGIDGIDGYWPYLHGAAPLRIDEIDVSVDEDQLENAERGHTTEQIMGIVFETVLAVSGTCDAGEGGTPDCNGICEPGDAGWDNQKSFASVTGDPTPDCNTLCEDPREEGTADCDGVCDDLAEGGSSDCDGFCQFDEVGGPDCDGNCAIGDAAGVPGGDCDDVCEPDDEAGSVDCDGYCDSDEGGSTDCDGICEIGDAGATAFKGTGGGPTPDCNDNCDSRDEIGTADCATACGGGPCDGACDAGDQLSVDCNDICEFGDAGWGVTKAPNGNPGTPDCNGDCDVPAEVGSSDCASACDGDPCNGLCETMAEGITDDCNDVCEPGDTPQAVKALGDDDDDSPDCDGDCDLPGEIDSPDCAEACGGSPCDGFCDYGEGFPDCDGDCDPGDSGSTLFGLKSVAGGAPDCNGRCNDPTEDGTADCNGICQDTETGLPDCDGSCDLRFEVGSEDCETACDGDPCDGFCDPGETGTLDCDGVCEVNLNKEIRGGGSSADCDGMCDGPAEANTPDCDDDCNGGPCDGFCDPGEDGTIDCDGRCDSDYSLYKGNVGNNKGNKGDPPNGGDMGSEDCNGVCDENEFGTPDCNGLCDPGDEGWEGEAKGGFFIIPLDCDGFCDAASEADTADCDGVCNEGIELGMPGKSALGEEEEVNPDCDGVCNYDDLAGSFDCDGECDLGDVAGSPDCDGICNVGEPANNGDKSLTDRHDCDGICSINDEPLSVDCSGSCDPADPPGSPDCDGVCVLPAESGTADCFCGDGVVDTAADETCDPPGSSAGVNNNTCQADCTVCGDGVVDPGEECDDGDTDNSDGCSNDCVACPEKDTAGCSGG